MFIYDTGGTNKKCFFLEKNEFDCGDLSNLGAFWKSQKKSEITRMEQNHQV